MKNRFLQRRILVLATIAVVLLVLVQTLQKRCSERPEPLMLDSPIRIHALYPGPGAKIPFACHILAFLKSPFAPRGLPLYEVVYKEDGLYRLKLSDKREGVVTADISIAGELYPIFNEDMENMADGEMPLFARSISIYVDGKKLRIGHIGWKDIDSEFRFATILNPFLWPGKHVGKINLVLPSGETREYEWQFEITWW